MSAYCCQPKISLAAKLELAPQLAPQLELAPRMTINPARLLCYELCVGLLSALERAPSAAVMLAKQHPLARVHAFSFSAGGPSQEVSLGSDIQKLREAGIPVKVSPRTSAYFTVLQLRLQCAYLFSDSCCTITDSNSMDAA